MPTKSTATRYGSVAVTLHWLAALLILGLLVSGFLAGSMQDPGNKIMFLRLHLPLGITVLILTLGRIGWWLWADTKPRPVAMPLWQKRLSHIVHILLYVVILGMSTSGIGMMVLSGAGPIIFGGPAASLPDFHDFLPRIPHGIAARGMILLLLLHIGGALHHHFVRGDGLLRRIWYTRSS